MGQREQLRAKLEGLTIKNKKCVDFGSGAKPALKYVKHTGCTWACVDKNPDIVDMYKQLNVSYIVQDLADTKQFKNIDVAFCMEVLEHTLYPRIIANNIHASLKKGGKLFMSVPFLYPEHGDEDYWRFTKNGLNHLLKAFKKVEIESLEGDTGYFIKAIK